MELEDIAKETEGRFGLTRGKIAIDAVLSSMTDRNYLKNGTSNLRNLQGYLDIRQIADKTNQYCDDNICRRLSLSEFFGIVDILACAGLLFKAAVGGREHYSSRADIAGFFADGKLPLYKSEVNIVSGSSLGQEDA